LIEHRYLIRQNLVAIVGICLSIYFSYHLITGERSYFRLVSLENQIERVSAEHQRLTSERSEIERKVVMLRPGTIDRDLLEERVRYVLGYRYADEKILLQGRL